MNNTQSNALTEANIPGASLGNREPEKFKIMELRFWLQCRGAAIKVEDEGRLRLTVSLLAPRLVT